MVLETLHLVPSTLCVKILAGEKGREKGRGMGGDGEGMTYRK